MKLIVEKVLKTKLFNVAAFNGLWLSCVVGQNDFMWITAPLLLAYLGFLISNAMMSLSGILVPASIGIVADISLTLTGVFQFQDAALVIPIWLIVLWLGFASTLSQSLSIFGKKKWIAAVAGAVSFPLNYGVGEKLGAVAFGETYLTSMLIMALLWAVLLPLCFYLSEGVLQSRQGDENVTV
jgi:hypothetical protein